MAQLSNAGYTVSHDPDTCEGEICVVNTCGFIGDAKEESINAILEQGQRRSEGSLKRLYVMGCLSQRYLGELKAEIPEVDGCVNMHANLKASMRAWLPSQKNRTRS